MDAAIVKTLHEAGASFDSVKMSSSHCVDNRNYYGYKHTTNELGLAVSVCDIVLDVSRAALDDFWSSAKKYHAVFKEEFYKKGGLERHVIDKLIGRSTMGALDPQGQSEPSSRMTYYCSTNARDLTAVLGDSGDNIQLEFFTWLSHIFTFPSIWISAVHTFRRKLNHSLQYNAHLIDRQTAERIKDAIFEMMKKVIE